VLHIVIALALHYLALFIYSYSFFSDFCNFYIYFLSGALLSEMLLNTETRNKILNPSYLKWIFPLFLIGQYFWFENNAETLTRKDALQEIRPGYESIFLVINYIGCFVLFIFSLLLAKSRRYEWLAYIGKNSLYIYILHVQIAAVMRKIIRDIYPNVDPWLLLGICFICGIIIPLLLIANLKKYGIERLFTLPSTKKL
jgi:fucose 4-O-acetylase-like acetyltransferase